MTVERKFFGQPKFSGEGVTAPVGYELFVREFNDGRWVLPDDFNSITADELEHLLLDAIHRLPDEVSILSFNLEQHQFVDPAYRQMVRRIQDATPIVIFTELTERVNPDVTQDALLAAAKAFHDDGLRVCIDDVGTEGNDQAFVEELEGYVDEYKFAMQNLRPFKHVTDIVGVLAPWYTYTQKHRKMMAIEGIETDEDLAYLKEHFPCDVLQGYYLGKPTDLKE